MIQAQFPINSSFFEIDDLDFIEGKNTKVRLISEKDANKIFRTNGVIFRYDRMNEHIFTNQDATNNALLTPNAKTPILRSTKDGDSWRKVKNWDDERLVQIGRSTPEGIPARSKEYFENSESLGDDACTHWGVYDLKAMCAVEGRGRRALALDEGKLLHRFAPPKPVPKQQQQNIANNNNNNNNAAANNTTTTTNKSNGKKNSSKK